MWIPELLILAAPDDCIKRHVNPKKIYFVNFEGHTYQIEIMRMQYQVIAEYQ